MSNVLVASLGESPAVVSVMYDLLTQRERLAIDEVVVLYPEGSNVRLAYELLVKYALQGRTVLHSLTLPFEDANTEQYAYAFLRQLFLLLEEYQEHNDTVYFSLAGGRKSMAALMAWVVPFFSCVKKLYHVIDPDADSFPTVEAICDKVEHLRHLIMHPDADDLARLYLVDIPFSPDQILSPEDRQRLLTVEVDEDEDEEDIESFSSDEEAYQEGKEFVSRVFSGDKTLDVYVTEHARRQYLTMCKRDALRAQDARRAFEHMKSATKLRRAVHLHTDDIYDKSCPSVPHFFKKQRTSIRSVFYTLPRDIHSASDEYVDKVVVCALEPAHTKKGNDEGSLIKITSDPDFTWEPYSSIATLPQNEQESILIVPLGKAPMVATQLYTLLTKHERHTIREVMLVYPQSSAEIDSAATMLKRAFREESNIVCKQKYVPGLADVRSTNDCVLYQRTLEEVIDQAYKKYPRENILLSLSGGRKGMAAMTMSVAGKKGIPYLYHTLITDEKLNQQVDTLTVSVLNDLTQRGKRNNYLFLRAYEGEGPYTKFSLFKVPVIAARRKK